MDIQLEKQNLLNWISNITDPVIVEKLKEFRTNNQTSEGEINTFNKTQNSSPLTMI